MGLHAQLPAAVSRQISRDPELVPPGLKAPSSLGFLRKWMS
jgi:hypothetical protein